MYANEGAESQGSVQLLSCVRLFVTPNCSTPSFPVHHQLPELVQTHVHQISDGECKTQLPLAVDSNQQWRKEKHLLFPIISPSQTGCACNMLVSRHCSGCLGTEAHP